MRFSTITAASTLALVQAKLGPVNVRKLKPSDAGAYHTEGIEQLAQKYSNEKPGSKLDLISDVSSIAASFCPTGDSLCQSNAYKTTLQHFQNGGKPVGIEYPSEFDSRVSDAISDVFASLKDANEDNIDSVVEDLRLIQERIEDLENANELHQVVGLSAVSVAIESSTQWHAVYSDEVHPLNKMVGRYQSGRGLGQRRAMGTVIGVDVEAAVNAGINAINNSIEVLAVWPNIVLEVIPDAYAASITAAFVDNYADEEVDGDEDGDGDDDYEYGGRWWW